MAKVMAKNKRLESGDFEPFQILTSNHLQVGVMYSG
jgi:hypothetical protein